MLTDGKPRRIVPDQIQRSTPSISKAHQRGISASGLDTTAEKHRCEAEQIPEARKRNCDDHRQSFCEDHGTVSREGDCISVATLTGHEKGDIQVVGGVEVNCLNVGHFSPRDLLLGVIHNGERWAGAEEQRRGIHRHFNSHRVSSGEGIQTGGCGHAQPQACRLSRPSTNSIIASADWPWFTTQEFSTAIAQTICRSFGCTLNIRVS
jgi:hypothetical protein